MTDKDALRDARLAQALRHMPDAHMQPSAEARLAVLKHAQQALSGGANTAPPAARRWWQSTSPSAWGGALASVLVASFITLMWYDQPVPDVNPEGLPAAQEATVPAAPPAIAKPARPVPPEPFLAEKKREARTVPPQPPQSIVAAAPAPAFAPPVVAPAAPAAPAPFVAAPHAPAPSKEIAVAATRAGASVADEMQRNRADVSSSAGATVLQDGKTSRLSHNQAQALLGVLRALPYGVTNANLQQATDKPAFTVRSVQGELWVVSPRRVQFQPAQFSAGAAQSPQPAESPITDAQWQQLRSLALPAP